MNDLSARDARSVWHPFSSLNAGANIPIVSGKGIWLHAADGRKFLDGISSWWVNLFGHGNETIAKAIADQALQLEQVIFAGFTHQPAVDLAESLLNILPAGFSRIFFSDNGSTSVEVAIKMALQYWHNIGVQRSGIIAMNGAYHGDTFGAMSAGERNTFNKPFQEKLFPVDSIPFPEEGKEEAVLENFEQLCSKGNIAAFIYEPLLQGTAGMRIYAPEVLHRLIEIAKVHEVICIADEVLTGFGRTGRIFASDHVTAKPDIICMSKGITGGFLPLGVTGCAQKIVDAYKNDDKDKVFYHGHSYTANPLACAAANASLKLLLAEDTSAAWQMINDQHQIFCRYIKQRCNISEAKYLGTVLSIRFGAQKDGYFSEKRDQIYEFFLNRGILLRPLGNVVYVLPPYIIKKDELALIYEAVDDLCQKL